ncbi:hypothetical protein Cgig2_004365 [Carnegiea gigantea]|uniref:Uncharacterized protein n=1 Tax=Carnegiea gigantea TaxID=171969 RepID=A0A9Q1JMZ6_9CARY|nr:hypothetical protein Cgig2_004365 [Carnegiea gigantea]
MADAITRQVSEQVKRAMEVARACRGTHRPEGMLPLRPIERSREVTRSDRSDRLPPRRGRVQRWSLSADPHKGQLQSRQLPLRPMRPTPGGPLGLRSRNRLLDKRQIDRFLKRDPRFLRQEQTPTLPLLRDEECSTEVVTTIAGGYEVKNKFKRLEVDFLVVNVPTTYNVIIGRPTLHRVKAVVAPGIQGHRSGLTGRPAPWLGPHQLRPSPAGATALSFRSRGSLGPLAASVMAFTPLAKTLAMAISSSETFGGSEAPGAAKSQDLTISWTRESLTLGSALMTLAEGRGVSEEAPLTTEVTTPMPLEGGSAPLTTGFPIGEQTAGRPSPPPSAKERMPRSRQGVPQSSASYGPASSQRASSRGVQGRAPEKKGAASLLPAYARQRLPLVQEWKPQSRRPSAEPLLDLYKTNRKSGSEGRLRLASSLLGRLHRLNRLSHEPRDGLRPIILAYIEHKVTGSLSFLSRGLPEGVSNWFPLILIRNIAPT